MRSSLFLLTAALSLSLAGAGGAALAQGGRHFARTDTNGDGKISLSEFLAARGRIFERIDANHDGVITKDEVAAASQAAEAAAAGRMIRSGKEAGEGGGGQLKRLEKMAERGPVTRQMWDQMMTRRFEKLDVDHTGYITMAEMRPGRGAEESAASPASEGSREAMSPGSASDPNTAVPMATRPPRR